MVNALAFRLLDGPFQWGRSDCCLAACDVFAALWGVDPAAGLRGTYRTRAGAARIIVAHGGFAEMVRVLAARAGLVRCDPHPGALAVVEAATGPALAVALDGGGFAGKGRGEVMVVSRAVEVFGCPR